MAATPGASATFEIGGIEVLAGHNVDGVPFPALARQIREAYAAGEAVELTWSSMNPITNGGAGHNTAPMSVASVLPGGESHEKYVRWLDHVAMFIEQLTDAEGRPIPLEFRLFHEHEDDRFWWSTGGEHPCATPEEFDAITHFTVEYLSELAGLHNVVCKVES
ncbi:glycosyl hydrolase [Gryllotalpicola koreensis]|uniref:GH26 domain-containing protein n=1 Tax=Gryllotalpicola koreensis TaxID=993086 RepID=A0ABP8A7F6_9MICO